MVTRCINSFTLRRLLVMYCWQLMRQYKIPCVICYGTDSREFSLISAPSWCRKQITLMQNILLPCRPICEQIWKKCCKELPLDGIKLDLYDVDLLFYYQNNFVNLCLSLVSHFEEIIRYAAANHSIIEGFPQRNDTGGSPAFSPPPKFLFFVSSPTPHPCWGSQME